MHNFSLYTLEELLAWLPSRLCSIEPGHHSHQLVIEKFPNKTWSATYVCLGCKGKTLQVIRPDFKDTLLVMCKEVEELLALKAFKIEAQ